MPEPLTILIISITVLVLLALMKHFRTSFEFSNLINRWCSYFIAAASTLAISAVLSIAEDVRSSNAEFDKFKSRIVGNLMSKTSDSGSIIADSVISISNIKGSRSCKKYLSKGFESYKYNIIPEYNLTTDQEYFVQTKIRLSLLRNKNIENINNAIFDILSPKFISDLANRINFPNINNRLIYFNPFSGDRFLKEIELYNNNIDSYGEFLNNTESTNHEWPSENTLYYQCQSYLNIIYTFSDFIAQKSLELSRDCVTIDIVNEDRDARFNIKYLDGMHIRTEVSIGGERPIRSWVASYVLLNGKYVDIASATMSNNRCYQVLSSIAQSIEFALWKSQVDVPADQRDATLPTDAPDDEEIDAPLP